MFADSKNPLRPSSLDKLIKCPLWLVLSMGEPEDQGGIAAQTGSLVHEAVAAFHLELDVNKKGEIGLATLSSSFPKFPLADTTSARLSYTHYANDPRNYLARIVEINGKFAIEYKVTLQLTPHPSDPTGEPVFIEGTLDQIRVDDDGGLYIYDVKTGSAKGGWEMIHEYAYQQAAYTLAARQNGIPVNPGYIIRTYGYRVRGATLPSAEGVFFAMPFTIEVAHMLMERVALEVANIRRNEVHVGPGVYCNYCQHGGLSRCIPKAEDTIGLKLA